jgi:ADP-ribose pyrophosphatase YjhB (NUDIX family)
MKETSTAATVLIEDGKVLLVRHLKGADHLNDTFGLPAGRLEQDEGYTDAAIRELREETGLIAKPEDMTLLPLAYHALLERKNGKEAMVMKVFLCSKYTGGLQTSNETEPVWFVVNEIGSLNLIPNVANAIQQAVEFRNNK